MLCRDVVEGDAYLWTVLAGVVPKITVNDRTMTNQQWPPGVRTRTAVATMLFRWVSVTGNHVTIQPERKISKTFKKIRHYVQISLPKILHRTSYVTSSF